MKRVTRKQLSPLTLAFVGDAAFELFVRAFGALPTVLLKIASKYEWRRCVVSGAGKVYGTAHANFNRRRDSGFKRRKKCQYFYSKNAEPADYHAATGFEAMFGYLYLKGGN